MHRYTEAETQEILNRAAQAPQETYTSEELLRSAVELGISPDALARAEAEVREGRIRKEFDVFIQAKMKSECLKFAGLALTFATINLVTSPRELWFQWVILWWGISLATKYFRARDRRGEGYQRAFERWQAKGGQLGERELDHLMKA